MAQVVGRGPASFLHGAIKRLDSRFYVKEQDQNLGEVHRC